MKSNEFHVSLRAVMWGKSFIVLLIFGVSVSAYAATATTPGAWTTTLDQSKVMTPVSLTEAPCDLEKSEQTTGLVLDPSKSFQTIHGFGAALTESSAILFSKMPPEQRKKVFTKLFGTGGTRINLMRIPIGATDFSTSNYSCDDPAGGGDDPAGGGDDPQVQSFSYDRCMKNILPILKEILEINPGIVLVASAWSPPAWMKTSHDMVGGELKPQYFGAYAEYLLKFLQASETEGVHFEYITMLNEPMFNAGPGVRYPWMWMNSGDQIHLIRDEFGPRLDHSGLRTKILGFDHNWDLIAYPLELLHDPAVRAHLGGIAFHCYGGDVRQTADVNQYPGTETILTECSSGDWSPTFDGSFQFSMEKLLIGNLNAGSKGTIYWNLLLDADHGPTNGGCGNCRGIINYDEDGRLVKSPEYDAILLASQAIEPGAVRIGSTDGGNGSFSQVAVRNPDGSFGVLIFNPQKNGQDLMIRTPTGCRSVRLDAESALAVRI